MASNDDRAIYRRRYLAENSAARERNIKMGKAQRLAARDVIQNHLAEYRERLELRREELGLERGNIGRPPQVDSEYEKWKKHGKTYTAYPTEHKCWLHQNNDLLFIKFSDGTEGFYCSDCSGPSHPEGAS